MAEPRWEQLDNKEKTLCAEINLKPDDYLNLKHKIIDQQVRNKAMTMNMLKDRAKEFKNITDKLAPIYDFWVKAKFIN